MVLRVSFFNLLFLTACTTGEVSQADGVEVALDGKQLYLQNCGACHGADGDLGMSGAKPLSRSSMQKDSVLLMMFEGKGAMPPFEGMLSDEEQNVIAEHVLTLKK